MLEQLTHDERIRATVCFIMMYSQLKRHNEACKYFDRLIWLIVRQHWFKTTYENAHEYDYLVMLDNEVECKRGVSPARRELTRLWLAHLDED